LTWVDEWNEEPRNLYKPKRTFPQRILSTTNSVFAD
jgi:hypothetical protein